MLVKEAKLPFASESLSRAKAIDGYSLFVYRGVDATIQLKDSLGQQRQENRRL